MTEARRHRVRRLDRHRLPFRKRADLFGAARAHEPLRSLEIGIHVGGLGAPDAYVDLILRVLTGRGRPKSPRVWASPGPLPASIDPHGVTAFELVDLPEGGLEAIVRSEKSEWRAQLYHDDAWRWLAENELRDPSRVTDLRELEALAALGSDFIITRDPGLLRVRDHNLAKPLNLMTPEEGFVLAGVWSRITHHPYVAGSWGTSTGAYYSAFARALTPAGWPALSALAELARQSAGDRRLFELAASVLDRLASTGRCLDRLVATWQCETTEETIGELLDDFDRAVLNSWAIYDNLALLAGHSFRVRLRSPSEWTVLNANWQDKVAARGDPRARAIVDLVQADAGRLAASQAVRHQLVHRTRMVPARDLHGGRRRTRIEEPLVWLGDERGAISRLEEAVKREGRTPADWGVVDRLPPRMDAIGIVGSDGTLADAYEVDLGPQAAVDPLVFVLRVCAHAAWFANEMFRLLDPASDSRIVDPARHRAMPLGARGAADWYLPPAANAAVLSSPLSGLVDWAFPLG